MKVYTATASLLMQAVLVTSQLIAQIPIEYTYLLPRPFNNVFTEPFIDTNVTNSSVQATIDAARNATFISYTEEFNSLLGSSPTVKIIANSSEPFAFEAGISVPTTNQIWFTAFLSPMPGYLTILDLNTSTYFQPNLTGPAASTPINPNGGYFHNGLVYLTSFGNTTTSPTIVSIDPLTYSTTEIINSFFGLPINGPDDVTIATSLTTGDPCLFYSDFYFAAEGLPGSWSAPQQLPNAVWRFLPTEQSLQMIVSPHDVQTPNGLAVNRNNTLLYVSDGPDSTVFSTPYKNRTAYPSFPGIYVYDLAGSDGCTPVNKRLVGMTRQGFANGIKIDDVGRIWTFEYEGIVVRSPGGKVLGLINVYELFRIAGTRSPDVANGANFAIVGDTVYVLLFYSVFAVRFGEVIKSWY